MKRNLTLLISLALTLQALFAQKVNLVKNGTFEMGNTGFKTDYNLLGGHKNGAYSVTDNVTTDLYSKNWKNPLPSTGQFLFIDAFTNPRTDKRCWYQSISVQPNTTYIFSCSVASVIALDPPKLKFNVNGKSVSNIFNISGSNYWQTISTTYTTKRYQHMIEISIVDVNKESRYGNDFAIDNIAFELEKETPSVREEEAVMEIPPSIEEIKIDQKLQLSRIYFEQSKFNLLAASFPELNELAAFMKKYPTVRIRLEGHTDNLGNSQRNLELSENRAKEVKKYLVDQGIDENRIEWVGYGDQRPIYSNANEKLRQKNRRVEVAIISK
jgi:outer membrane protein OmpA-like peptidoglycan-associated protein